METLYPEFQKVFDAKGLTGVKVEPEDLLTIFKHNKGALFIENQGGNKEKFMDVKEVVNKTEMYFYPIVEYCQPMLSLFAREKVKGEKWPLIKKGF